MKRLCFFVLSLMFPVAASAQSSYNSPETGEKPLGTYFKTDIDSVSLTNGNLHLKIPLFSIPGRETSASAILEYDSQFYQQRQYTGYPSNTYVYEYMGWRKSSAVQNGQLKAMRSNPLYTWASTQYVTWTVTFTWAPPRGSVYTFTTTRRQDCSSITSYTVNGITYFVCNNPSPSDAALYDNLTIDLPGVEFIRLQTGTQFSGGSTPAYIIYKDGSRIDAQHGKLLTTNGNYLNGVLGSTATNLGASLGDGVPYQDTLGRTVGYTANTNPVTETITLQDANGQSQVYQIVWKSAPAYVASEQLNQSFQVVDYVQLPNSRRYTFDYNSEGMVSKVTLPSGAYIRYGYAHPGANLRAHVVSRWVSADGTAASEKLTSYSYSYFSAGNNMVSGCILASSVTDPAGSETRYFYNNYNSAWVNCSPPLPLSITMSTAGQVLKRIDQTWVGTQLASETTTMGDMVRKTQYTYDIHNNVTRIEDFDWGVGAPGARLRYVDKTYLDSLCTSDHICDRVTSEKIYTDAGTLVAETDYEYDNYSGSNALVTRTGTIPGWTSPTAARANVTATKQWLNTNNSWLVTTQQYDVLGNTVKVTDPGGHATNTDFTDRFSDTISRNSFAYPTRVTDPSGFDFDTLNWPTLML